MKIIYENEMNKYNVMNTEQTNKAFTEAKKACFSEMPDINKMREIIALI